jgi:nitroreductase
MLMPISEKFSKVAMMEIDPELLRAIIRERTHHTVEEPVYRILEGKMAIRPDHGNLVKHLLDIWKDRGLSLDYPDIKWADQLISTLDEIKQGRTPMIQMDTPKSLLEEELIVVKKTIYNRRSIRSFKNEEIPRWMIMRIVEAGLWAPSACNLQTIRVIVVDDNESLALFRKGEVKGGKIYLVICQDYRAYDFFQSQIPDYNRNYDIGAAVQNMILMAHALGLGAVWLTYGKDHALNIRNYFKLPDYMHIATYIALGWPKGGIITPERIRVEEAIIKHSGDIIG